MLLVGFMSLDISAVVKHRYTAKAYNPEKKVSPELLEKVRELIRFSPSSVNSQPWHVLIAGTEAGKARVAKATEGSFVFNKKAVLGASHVLVFCARNDINEDFLLKILDQEEADGRVPHEGEIRDKVHNGRSWAVNWHRNDLRDFNIWADRQIYLNVGQVALGVAALGIDATIMEGFDLSIVDQEFALAEKGLHSLVIMAIGYHDAEADHNAARPKSRLPYAEILTEF